MSEIPYFVRHRDVTTLDSTDSLYLDDATSDVPKKISITNFMDGLPSTYTTNNTILSGGTSQSISIGVAKNGTIITESEGIIRTNTSNVEHGGSTQAVLEMVANDYVELFVRNTSSTDIRVADFNFNIVKIPV